jgi:hypothetical protein
MKNKIFFLLSILIGCTLLSCSESTTPNDSSPSYVPLNVGDERQLLFTTDSSTVYYTVKAQLNRSDGLKIFEYNWYYGTDTIPGILYYALKDGYFIATLLDTLRDSTYYLPDNPFREQRLAKLYPKDGDAWLNIPGDSSATYFVAKNIGSQRTPAGLFYNCFSFTLDDIVSINYAKGIGHISSIVLPDSNGFLSTYLKVGGKVYGKKIPPKDPVFPAKSSRKNFNNLLSTLLGEY